MKDEYDLVVLGGGSGGVRAARIAARLGARVALVEGAALGGTCVNAGCIPKKLLFYAAEFGHGFHDALGFGFSFVESRFDWATWLRRKDAEIARLNRVYQQLLEEAGTELVAGYGRFVDAHTIEVGGRALWAHHVIVATGSTPHRPDVPGQELAITSDDAFHFDALPGRIIVVGGGYVALEFAGIFHGLGGAVHLVHRGEQILRGFDRELRDHLADETRALGVRLSCRRAVTALTRVGNAIEVSFDDGSSEHADCVLFATGRSPNTAALRLDRAGIELSESGAVPVDHHYRSRQSHIFAVGDCTGSGLTPVAIAQGEAVARSLFGGENRVADLTFVPTAVFSQPAVATVGYAEHEARARFAQIETFRAVFTPLRHRMSGRAQKSLVKVVVDAQSDRVVGCHMVGADAAEIIQGFAVALKLGVTKQQLDRVVGVHPTAAEEFVTLR